MFRYYGGTLSEKMLGKALKALDVPRNEYIVSTKCGRYIEGFDFSAERVTRSIDESLERLQLDYVDILQCHDIEFGSLDQVLFCFSLKNWGLLHVLSLSIAACIICFSSFSLLKSNELFKCHMTYVVTSIGFICIITSP